MALPENWPEHEFSTGEMIRNDENPDDPICYATLQTGIMERDGYVMYSECGYPRSEH